MVLFIAGHGDMRANDWYSLTYELTRPEDDQEVIRKGVSATILAESIKDIRSQKMLLLLDACYAGSAIAGFRGIEDRKALEQLARASGIYVVAASAEDQQAVELPELGHGVFTYVAPKRPGGRGHENPARPPSNCHEPSALHRQQNVPSTGCPWYCGVESR